MLESEAKHRKKSSKGVGTFDPRKNAGDLKGKHRERTSEKAGKIRDDFLSKSTEMERKMTSIRTTEADALRRERLARRG